MQKNRGRKFLGKERKKEEKKKKKDRKRMLIRVAEITSEKLTAAVKELCGSSQAGQSLQGALDGLEEFEDARQQEKPLSISSRTARTWLQKLGLNYGRMGKGIYKDGHEREDVKKYWQEVFAPSFCAHLKNSVQFDEDGNMKFPESVQHPIVFVTHDEAYFNANDATSFTWGNEDLQPIRPKGRGKGIMVSEFLTPAGRLSCQSEDQGRQYASRLIEPGAGKERWTNTMMIDQLKDAVRIFKKNFLGCTGVWLFDNSTNHGSFSPDALSSCQRLRLYPLIPEASIRQRALAFVLAFVIGLRLVAVMG